MTAPALPRGADRLRRTAAPTALLGGVAALAAAVALRDPHEAGSWGRCPFLVLTGLPCPLCGGLRAVWDVEHGQLRAALGSNAMAVAVAALGVGVLVVWWWRLWSGAAHREPPLARPRTQLAVLGVVVAFGVLRWLPGFDWLGP